MFSYKEHSLLPFTEVISIYDEICTKNLNIFLKKAEYLSGKALYAYRVMQESLNTGSNMWSVEDQAAFAPLFVVKAS